MATYTPKEAIQYTLDTTLTTVLATVPGGKSWIVRQIVVANKTATARNATVKLNGFSLLDAYPVPANDLVIVDLMQILTAGQTITGGASANSALEIHIGVVEFA